MEFERDVLEHGYEELRQAMLHADSKRLQSAMSPRAFANMGGQADGSFGPDGEGALKQMQTMVDEYVPALGSDFTIAVVVDEGVTGLFAWRPHPDEPGAGNQCVLARFVAGDGGPRIDGTHTFQLFPEDYESFDYESVKASIPPQARLDGDG